MSFTLSPAVWMKTHRKGGAGSIRFRERHYPSSGWIKENLDARGRYEALMAADDLFQVEASP